MKITKDSLLAENATLKATIAELEKKIEDGKEANKSVRQDISAALGAGINRNQWGTETEVVYNWNGIFREIGKLLERKTQDDLRQSVHQMESVRLEKERMAYHKREAIDTLLPRSGGRVNLDLLQMEEYYSQC